MSSRPGRSAQPPPPSSNRQNEYFVPRDGIDREVITADVCRYLGNDALVRPGVYESPQTGQVVQGYFITAYRNLTTAMIEDLKADSARWDQERRQQTARNPVGGTIASAGVYVQKSNSPVVQYRNSDTHQSRQYYGPTEGANQYQDASRDNYDAGAPRYPGTGSAGYNGASSQPAYPGSSPYGGQGGAYGNQPAYSTGQAQFAQSPQDSYPGGAPMSGSGFPQAPSGGGRPYEVVGAHRTVTGSGDYGANVAYTTGPRGEPVPTTSMVQGRPVYVTSGPPGQPGFTTSSGAYYSQNAAPTPAGFSAAQPVDSFYGRASPAGAQTFTSSTHDSQYETAPPSRNSAQPPSTQTASSGSSSRHNRDNRDSVDRHTDSRHRGHRSGR
ncbi:hypothetical protein PGQ11_002037 [Apiospora arundinis]|uniref:Transcription factor n=1 Tax=Apiospora arundinis TaxID=335852 RepID=A0ABR2JHT0_9PEZI